MQHCGGARPHHSPSTVSHELLSSKHKSSSLAGIARTAASGQRQPRPRGDGRRVLCGRNHPPTAGCWPGNAPCKNARLPMQSRPGRSGTRAPPTDPQLAPLVTGMSPRRSSAPRPSKWRKRSPPEMRGFPSIARPRRRSARCPSDHESEAAVGSSLNAFRGCLTPEAAAIASVPHRRARSDMPCAAEVGHIAQVVSCVPQRECREAQCDHSRLLACFVGAVSPSLSRLHGCGSGKASERAPDAWWTSSQRRSPAPLCQLPTAAALLRSVCRDREVAM